MIDVQLELIKLWYTNTPLKIKKKLKPNEKKGNET